MSLVCSPSSSRESPTPAAPLQEDTTPGAPPPLTPMDSTSLVTMETAVTSVLIRPSVSPLEELSLESSVSSPSDTMVTTISEYSSFTICVVEVSSTVDA